MGLRASLVLLVLWTAVCFSRGELPGIDSFFSDRQALQLSVAPDGKRWALLSQKAEMQSLKMGELGEGGNEEWIFGSRDQSVLSFHWMEPETGLIQIATPKTREIWTVSFSEGSKPSYRRQTLLAPTERLIGVDGRRFFTRKREKLGEDEISIYDLDSERARRLVMIPSLAEDVVASQKFALLHTFEVDGSAVLWKVDDEKRLLRTFAPDEFFRIVRINPDGKTAWITTNQGSTEGLTRFHRISLENGKTLERIGDATFRGDVVHCLFAPGEMSPSYVEFAHPESKTRWRDSDWQHALDSFEGYSRWRPVSVAEPGISIGAFQAIDSVGHPHFLVVDWEKQKVLLKVREYPALAGVKFGKRFPVVVDADDGFEIPTIVTLPPNWHGSGCKPAPTIVFPHGGPFTHIGMDFDLRVQFLASRGYVILQPNYRGSTGFGRRHQNAARRNWGPEGIQQDLDRVAAWAVSKKYADPRAIGIFGGSFGGYLALSTACFRADDYRCAAVFFAPSCMAELLLENPAGISPSASVLQRYFGDPRQERETMVRWSPRYGTPGIPLLVYHGGRDPLINVSHSTEMLRRWGGSGPAYSVETVFLLDPNGSHGFPNTGAEITAYTALEKFFAKHLGGKQRQPDAATLDRIEQWIAEGRRGIGTE